MLPIIIKFDIIKLLLKNSSIFINFKSLVEEWLQQLDKYKWNQHSVYNAQLTNKR